MLSPRLLRIQARRVRRAQRGVSIVEMMIGITVGLVIVAAASLTVATQLGDNRRLLLEVQVQQDLRAAADIIARDLRRAGYWYTADSQVWKEGSGGATANPHTAITSGSPNVVVYNYDRRAGGSAEYSFGFCQGSGCPSGDNVVRTRFASAPATPASAITLAWQPLTDDRSVNITNLTITPVVSASVRMSCPNLCPGGDTACWPTIAVREVQIALTGQSVADSAVVRSLTSRVRLRNDLLTISAAAGGKACPP